MLLNVCLHLRSISVNVCYSHIVDSYNLAPLFGRQSNYFKSTYLFIKPFKPFLKIMGKVACGLYVRLSSAETKPRQAPRTLAVLEDALRY